MEEESDTSPEDKRVKRSLAEDLVDYDNQHGVVSRKRRAMQGRFDRVMEIDLSVKLEEENGDEGESRVKKKGIRILANGLDKVNSTIVQDEQEGEPMESYEGIHDKKKPLLRVSTTSVSDSEINEQSKIQSQSNMNAQGDTSITIGDCNSPQQPIVGSQLESLHIEVGRMNEENRRLKLALSEIMSNYQNLQMHLFRVMQQEESNAQPEETPKESEKWEEESELVSLSLGTNPSAKVSKEETAGGKSGKEVIEISGQQGKGSQEHLKRFSLSLDFKDEDTSEENNEEITVSPRNSPAKSESGLIKRDSMNISVVGNEQFHAHRSPEIISRVKDAVIDNRQEGFWHSNKAVKTSHDAVDNSEVAPPIRKARVSVRARCEAPTMNDGCQWRKYGQKIAKGNPCPRAYYRCTVAPGCPVRKQVQRCPDDLAILITTYEGSHNHPLPIAATAMASTTAAAACMLLSGSTSSSDAMNANNPYMSRLDQCFGPNPTISTSSSFPTITLDLTTNPTSQLKSLPSTFSLPFRYPSGGSSLLSAPQHHSTILRPDHSIPAMP
ncbi:hypothetical protein KI387_003010, partial [Taxus chinensis]